MTKVTLEIHDDILKTLFKLENINDTGIDLEIPEGSVLFDNILNLKLIEKEAEKKGIIVHFTTKDPVGNNLITMLSDEEEPQTNLLAEMNVLESEPPMKTPKKFSPPKLPKINVNASKTARPLLFGVILATLLFGITIYLTRTQKAIIDIKVSSQPLARSVTVKVLAGQSSDTTKNVLAGTKVSTTLESTKEMATTGEKLIGIKSKGDIKIYNNTESDKKFKKGTTVSYKNDGVV